MDIIEFFEVASNAGYFSSNKGVIDYNDLMDYMNKQDQV